MSSPSPGPPAFTSAEDMATTVGDAVFWAPYGDAVLARVGLAPASRWSAPGGGSFPVLRTGTGLIVKFFGPFIEGPECYAAEAASLAALCGHAPVPTLRASGVLYSDNAADPDAWSWPYVVVDEVAGTAIFALRNAAAPVDDAALSAVAAFAGAALATIWRCPVPLGGEPRLERGWGAFVTLLHHRRAVAPGEHRAAGRLSPVLCDQLDTWLPSIEGLIDTSRPPTFLHGDLHGDHVFAVPAADGSGHYEGSAIIDLSDAIAGDPAYDLVSLHLDAFGGSPTLLAPMLDALPTDVVDLGDVDPRRLLAFSLLHEFDPFERWHGDRLAWLATIDDPDELAQALWHRQRPR